MRKALVIGTPPRGIVAACQALGITFAQVASPEAALVLMRDLSPPVGLVLFELKREHLDAFMSLRHAMLKDPVLSRVPFVAYSDHATLWLRRAAYKFKVSDYWILPLNTGATVQRIGELVTNHENIQTNMYATPTFSDSPTWQIPLWKRAIDIAGSLVLIVAASPILLLVAALIKLESRGPVLYISKRAGHGYQVFDFYKFRSMRVDADKMVQQLAAQNQYKAASAAAPEAAPDSAPEAGQHLLFADEGFIAEQVFKKSQAQEKAGTFFKVENDPRITRIGRFIRDTSIDELPQLFNVLKGDMSLVGNRPLPLYEAEQLTSDQHVLRFLAPAGITGLWQVTKRGQANMSEEERKNLDVEYALNFNLWMDIEILLKTLPAAIQRSNV